MLTVEIAIHSAITGEIKTLERYLVCNAGGDHAVAKYDVYRAGEMKSDSVLYNNIYYNKVAEVPEFLRSKGAQALVAKALKNIEDQQQT